MAVPKIAKRIWVPKSLRPKFHCLVPGCEHPGFTESERGAYERHVADCVQRNADSIEDLRQEQGMDSYFVKPADEEYFRWVSEHGGGDGKPDMRREPDAGSRRR